jgi:phospholipid/cholesterol/gamma-HCH transport system substrate-binding protein
MNATQSSLNTRIKVGGFTLLGLIAIVIYTVLANNRPFWWRSCQLVKINVEDATGLKTKAPIRSLGIEIGYLKSVMLSETHVSLGICITAPVEVLPTTRAYIRGEGFLGDKFVELKPIRYTGPNPDLEKPGVNGNESNAQPTGKSPAGVPLESSMTKGSSVMARVWNFLFPEALASAPLATKDIIATPEPKPGAGLVSGSGAQRRPSKNGREIPVGEETADVQHLVTRVDELVAQMTNLTDNLKQAIHPDELRQTMKQLNQTLENASKTLAPEGGLNQTAQRSLAKLEDAIEQLRDLMTRVNKGEGSVGMLLNDPSYAEEIRSAVKNVNKMLNKVADVRFVVDLGASPMTIYNGTRGWFHMGIWPKKDRYYLLGISSDPRGRLTNLTTTTVAGGLSQTTQTITNDSTGILITGMLGKVFWDRLDLSIGALYGDGAASIGIRLGPHGNEEAFEIRNDVYSRSAGGLIDDRVTLRLQPFGGALKGIYAKVGIESVRGYNSNTVYFYGAGLRFDDEDIKLLFALR